MTDTTESAVEFIATVPRVLAAKIVEMSTQTPPKTFDVVTRQQDFVYQDSQRDDFSFIAGILFFVCLGVYALIRICGA